MKITANASIPTKKYPDPELRRRVSDLAVKFETILGLEPETIFTNGENGVVLTADQADALIAMIEGAPMLPVHALIPDKCNCRCNEGRHCGGCGHEGCGYTP